jgi:hypothetical protein
MDANELYREELYTDRKVGTIRVMVPITADGATDAARRTSYVGQAQIMTNAGTLPISFEIDAGHWPRPAKFADGAVAFERREGTAGDASPAGVLDRHSGRRRGVGPLGQGGVPPRGEIKPETRCRLADPARDARVFAADRG